MIGENITEFHRLLKTSRPSGFDVQICSVSEHRGEDGIAMLVIFMQHEMATGDTELRCACFNWEEQNKKWHINFNHHLVGI